MPALENRDRWWSPANCGKTTPRRHRSGYCPPKNPPISRRSATEHASQHSNRLPRSSRARPKMHLCGCNQLPLARKTRGTEFLGGVAIAGIVFPSLLHRKMPLVHSPLAERRIWIFCGFAGFHESIHMLAATCPQALVSWQCPRHTPRVDLVNRRTKVPRIA